MLACHQEALKKLRDCQESLASSENEKGALKKQVEDLTKKVAKLENDIKLGMEQLDAKNAEIDTLKKRVAELEDELKKLRQQLAALKEEMDKLTKELAALKEERDKLAKHGKAAGDLEAELKKLREQLAALKEERDKLAKEAALLKDAQDEIERLKKLLEDREKKVAELEDELKKLRQQLAALKEEMDKLTKELAALKEERDKLAKHGKAAGDLEAELKKLREQLAALKEERDKLAKEAALLKDAQDEIERLKKLLADMEAALKLVDEKTSKKSVDFDLERAIQLTTLSKELVAKEHWIAHEHVKEHTEHTAAPIKNRTTVGIAFDDRTCVITNVLVGGPAFNSKKVFKGDKIVSVDSVPVVGGDVIPRLKGSDVPGSVVTIGLQRKDSNSVDEVKLRRMDNTQIADKRQIFELFTKLIDKSHKNRDKDSENYTTEALDLWTAEMLEEYEHDQRCLDNLHKMQRETDIWLEELLQILMCSEQGEIKRAAPPKIERAAAPPAAPLISKEDLEKLQKENEALKEKLAAVQQDLENLRPKLSQLQQELQGANSALDSCAAAANRKDAEIEDLKKRLAELQKAYDDAASQLDANKRQLDKDQSDISDKDAEIAELKRKLAALEAKLKEKSNTAEDENLKKRVAELEQLLAAQSAAADELEKLRAKLASIQSELKVAKDALDAATAGMLSKDAEIEDLKKRLVALEKELKAARDEMNNSTGTRSDEIQKLLAKLAALQSELKTATDALAAASAGMIAKDAEIEDLKKRLAALQKELQDARDEMDDSSSKQAQLSKCRELIAMSQRRIAEDHLAEHEILTHADQSATTIGLMFDETGGKIHVDYVMVGGPAFKTKNIAKDDIILSIDGKKLQGDAVIKALQGPANTVVTLEVEKAKTGKVEMVEVERMPTAIIADKRKMFDLFTKIEGGFNKHKDPAGVKNTEDALELWTNMLMEEKEHDDKCVPFPSSALCMLAQSLCTACQFAFRALRPACIFLVMNLVESTQVSCQGLCDAEGHEFMAYRM
jgi:predicted  nucleic acid-binding Zn-ribbon protein